ncbi:amino acid adenylation domain-containing protein [Micromonospora sp. NBC_01699]|uniref:amino acid adenylation domain-containing protein n=1 Tax=Micromonospora sp. NBC_01699 TaxID=2975984 RepID=UPI002E2890E1|nr:amino acid adenylation domain-containing protein [Micromonospora sp. NBC_01699]
MTEAGAAVPPYPEHILDLLEPHLRPDSTDTALVDPTTSLTYGELDGLTRRVAAGLRRQGIVAGEPVVVRARLSGWAIIALLGVLRAGGRYVPVDAAFPVERQRLTLQQSGARLALVQPGVEPMTGPWLSVDLGPLVGGAPPPDRDWRGPDAYTYFTSGTTGQPKAVTVPASALAYSTAARLAYYREPVDGFLLCSSISFDSSVAGIFWTLASGGRLIIPSDRPSNLVAVQQAAARHRASHLLMVPSLYAVLLRSADPARLAALTTVVVAGEVCPPALVAGHFATLADTALYNEYGPTECTVWSTVHRCTPADAIAPTVPIGTPIPGTTVSLRTLPGGEPVPAGAVGELWIGGPGVASGAEHHRTGDLASIGPDGLLSFHGRADDQLKLGGVRIELAEIERALTGYVGITAGALGRSRHGDGRITPVAFVVLAGEPLDTRAIRAFLLARLPAVAVPTRYVVLDRLPTQPNGKLDRGALDRLASTG